MRDRGTIVFAAALAQRPGIGGHTWWALQYLLGLRRLGWDVLLLDRLPAEVSTDATGAPCPGEESVGVRYLAATMERFGLRDAWSVLVPGREALGVSRREVERRLDAAAAVINAMGYLDDEDLLGRPGLRVFLDIDPGFGQMWRTLGLHDPFEGHDAHVTVGLNIGRPGCRVPDCGLEWIPTLPPVVLDEWPVTAGDGRFTTVASWRGPFGPIEFGGRTYGLRVHEFRRFLDLPGRTSATFELALDIDPVETADLERLRAHGWRLVAPADVAGDAASYRSFVQGSRAELNVAKHLYVETRGGWFSDRSACYLASGKPVLAQDTGLAEHLPTGAGLLVFRDPDEAAAAVEAVCADPTGHARAARAIAEEHFDSDRVLELLLRRLGVG